MVAGGAFEGGVSNELSLIHIYATSKLRAAEDLLSIATLGFRGEALPTIAAISRLVLETRMADEEQGMRVEFAGGRCV